MKQINPNKIFLDFTWHYKQLDVHTFNQHTQIFPCNKYSWRYKTKYYNCLETGRGSKYSYCSSSKLDLTSQIQSFLFQLLDLGGIYIDENEDKSFNCYGDIFQDG